MTRELTLLVAAALLSLGLTLATVVIHFRRFGGPMIRSNRDHYPALDGLAARVVRAHASLNEALLPFAAIALVAAVVRVSTATTMLAAAAFVVARVAHAGLYLAGITVWRSVAFYAGVVATLVFAAQLPLAI